MKWIAKIVFKPMHQCIGGATTGLEQMHTCIDLIQLSGSQCIDALISRQLSWSFFMHALASRQLFWTFFMHETGCLRFLTGFFIDKKGQISYFAPNASWKSGNEAILTPMHRVIINWDFGVGCFSVIGHKKLIISFEHNWHKTDTRKTSHPQWPSLPPEFPRCS